MTRCLQRLTISLTDKYRPRQPLALDHLTLVDATPVQLAQAASDVGCSGMCVFLQSMDVLPLMPHFDLVNDASARRAVKARMDDLGLRLDLAYPFTLTGRTDVAGFEPMLACAADLDTQYVNVLVYDRDLARREDIFASFCDRAASFGLKVALEFYPLSQVRSLADALALVLEMDRPGDVGVNVDLLHLMRSGGSLAELAAAPDGAIVFGQCADGPSTRPEAEWAFEASSDRLSAGEGVFDVAGFARALPVDCPISVEIPNDRAVQAGLALSERARRAVESVRAAMAMG